MERFFNMDNAFFTFMGRVADLLILNILWLVCCIPLVTIGPATAALYYALLKIVRKEDSYAWSMFFRSFRQNLKQGICLTLIFMALGLLLFVDIRVSVAIPGTMGQILTGLFLVLVLFFLILTSYTFPVLAQFDNNIKNTLKNSFLIALSRLPYTLVIVLLNLLPILLLFISPYHFMLTMPLWLFLGIAVIAWINCRMFVKIFAPYMPEEETDSELDSL